MAEITCLGLDKPVGVWYNDTPIPIGYQGILRILSGNSQEDFFAVGIVKLAPMRGYILTLKISVISPLYSSEQDFCPDLYPTLKIY